MKFKVLEELGQWASNWRYGVGADWPYTPGIAAAHQKLVEEALLAAADLEEWCNDVGSYAKPAERLKAALCKLGPYKEDKA